jgi:hypothetical protein
MVHKWKRENTTGTEWYLNGVESAKISILPMLSCNVLVMFKMPSAINSI